MILSTRSIMANYKSPLSCFVFSLLTLSFIFNAGAASSFCNFVSRKISLRAFREGDVIPVAVNQTVFDELVDVVSSGDNQRFAQLLLSGKVFEINNYTEVLVLTIISSKGRAYVQILRGPYSGKKVWVDIDRIDSN